MPEGSVNFHDEIRGEERLSSWEVVCADSKDYLPTLAENSVDLVLTDPPYALNNHAEVEQRIWKAICDVSFPYFNEVDPDFVVELNLAFISLQRSLLGEAKGGSVIDAGIGVPECSVNFHNDIVFRDEEVSEGGESSQFISEDVLSKEVDTEGSQFIGDFILYFGNGGDASASDVFRRCQAQLFSGGLAVAVSVGLPLGVGPCRRIDAAQMGFRTIINSIGASHHPFGKSETLSPVVAVPTAIHTFVLRLDCRGSTGEMFPTNRADKINLLTLLPCPTQVGTPSRTIDLTTMLEPYRISIVSNTTDGAEHFYFNLWLPKGFSTHILHIIPRGGFMSKSWDATLPDPAIWRECLRVLKPGGFMAVMSGPRMDCLWRLGRDLEEAGFDVSQSPLFWVYRSGFPKSLSLSKDFDKAAFVEWLKSPWNDSGETRAEAMGWGAVEIRKATSAAVNGDNPPMPGGKGNLVYSEARAGMLDPERARERLSLGASLLSSLLVRFPDAPGVRVKVGEYRVSGNALTSCADKGGTYGVGVPNSPPGTLSVTAPSTPLARQWEGWHSYGLKPTVEVIVVAQKSFTGTSRGCVSEWGTGAINVDACRIPSDEPIPINVLESWSGFGELKRPDYTPSENQKGRYPANVLVSDEALGPEGSKYFSLEAWKKQQGIKEEEGWDEAAAAGIVQVKKASSKEKNEGLEDVPGKTFHPTVKPVALMSYLCHLLCQPGGLVVDPFCGSGSTGVAAIQGGWRFLGVDIDEEYCKIARARCRYAEENQ